MEQQTQRRTKRLRFHYEITIAVSQPAVMLVESTDVQTAYLFGTAGNGPTLPLAG